MDGNFFTVSSFGDLGFFRVQCQGHMGEFRNRFVESPIDQDLFRSIGQVILAPDDVGDAVPDIVHCVGKYIKGLAVGSYNDKIIDVLIFFFDAAVNLVGQPNGTPGAGNPHPNGKRDALFFLLFRFFRRHPAAGAVIPEGLLVPSRSLSFAIQILFAAKTAIGVTRCQ